MTKVIATEKAPAALGPYSQGLVIGNVVMTSGQIPLNPETGEMPETIEEQTRQSLENVKAILTEGGTTLEKAIHTTVFLQDLGDFDAMNAVYATFFEGTLPVRSCVQVAKLPKNAKVEIEVMATLD